MLDYQDALFASGAIPGERSGEERWALVAPYLPSHGVVLDVGSNLGYFGLRMTQARPDVAVVSLEANDAIADEQRRIVASHRNRRICIIQGQLSADVARAWSDTCDWFDLTLLLSVIHWFDEPASVVRDLSRMSARLIMEVPDSGDAGACGQQALRQWRDPVRWFEEATGRRCTPLGRVSRHTSAIPSHVLLIDGPVSRSPRVAYWGSVFEHPEGNAYRLHYDGERIALEIRHRRVNYVPGINLVSLMKLGRLIWPSPGYWVRSGISTIRAWPGHGDPLTHNMLWTPAGVRLIDGDDQRADVQGFAACLHFAANIVGWHFNRMTVKGAYTPHASRLWRRARSLLRRVLPARVRAFLRSLLNSRRRQACS